MAAAFRMAVREDRRQLLGWAIALAFAIAVFVAHGAQLAVPLVDDAAISVDFAVTLASGDGFRVNPVSQVVEAFSNPLWVFTLGLATALRLDPTRFASVAGEGLAMASLLLFGLWGWSARGKPRVTDALGPLLAACTTPFVYWSCSGMETGLHAWLLALSGWLVLAQRRRGVCTGLALGGLCLTRPEGFLYALAAIVLWMTGRAGDGARRSLSTGVMVLTVTIVFGGYLLFRRLYFDAWLPNTYVAKRYEDFLVGGYLWSFATAHVPAVIAGGVGSLVALVIGKPPERRQTLLALGFVAAGLYFVVHVRGDWMRQWRFLAVLVPCWGQTFGAGFGALGEAGRGIATRAASLTTAALAALLCFACAIREAAREVDVLRAAPELPAADVASRAYALVVDARSLGVVRPRVAAPDIGGLSRAMRDAEIIDTGQLADIALAQHLGNPQAAEDYLLTEVEPDYLDLHGPSLRYATELPRLMERYTPLRDVGPGLDAGAGVLRLAELTNREDPRCPGGRAVVRGLSVEALAEQLEQAMVEDRPVVALRLWRCALAFRTDGALPQATWRKAVARRAHSQSKAQEGAGQLELSLRFSSLATVLSGGDPHYRRRTEALRERLFPRPKGA